MRQCSIEGREIIIMYNYDTRLQFIKKLPEFSIDQYIFTISCINYCAIFNAMVFNHMARSQNNRQLSSCT